MSCIIRVSGQAHLLSDDDAIKTEEKIWDLTQNINVKGVWFGCKHALIQMQKVRRRSFLLLLGTEIWGYVFGQD